MSRSAELRDWFQNTLPIYSRSVEDSRHQDPDRFDRLAETFLGWANAFLGKDYLDRVARAYAGFTTSVNLHQARYEITGRYEPLSAEEFKTALYEKDDLMADYLWGVFLTTFLWPHHLKIARLYEEEFLPALTPGTEILELAFGHGGWGIWALSQTGGTKLTGIDIAESSVTIARGLANSAGVSDRAEYSQGDALRPAKTADFTAAICGFVVEHLEQPQLLFQALASHLRPGSKLFLTGALTAAQEDHIFEFRRESELLILAEEAGFRVLQTLSEGPQRTLPNAKYLPRSMALLLERRSGEIF